MNSDPSDRDGRPDHAPADGTQINEISGTPDYKTGYQMPDRKDHHEEHYTSTPPEDRVAGADEGKYQAPHVPDPKEVTGQFDHLATRDPARMEQVLQSTPEFAGAQTVDGLGMSADTPMDLVAPMAPGMGVMGSMATAQERRQAALDPNPGYTPPSQKSVPHVGEQPGDLPPGAPSELKAEVDDSEDARRSL
ncbi:hypothetical protein [Deinococcus hopiensis]|uniref:Uncharacterized protein n=1 Tax=Deinococcus hopiensis KR-140 TaxID=695939 RepID=A0A1W1VQA2_9DEIO|nr:hypothetical protein [Deinococcus hopiensis]SMB95400.1 hypothetical protein SAMN00790413_02816 [Deinococcus hopiensis KR-140]